MLLSPTWQAHKTSIQRTTWSFGILALTDSLYTLFSPVLLAHKEWLSSLLSLCSLFTAHLSPFILTGAINGSHCFGDGSIFTNLWSLDQGSHVSGHLRNTWWLCGKYCRLLDCILRNSVSGVWNKVKKRYALNKFSVILCLFSSYEVMKGSFTEIQFIFHTGNPVPVSCNSPSFSPNNPYQLLIFLSPQICRTWTIHIRITQFFVTRFFDLA